MPSRRRFLHAMFATLGAFTAPGVAALASEQIHFEGEDVFNRIVSKALAGKWRALPIGEVMGKVARELEGTPYREATLEISADREVCSVNLSALDCVTFFESTLDLARMIKMGGNTPADLLKQVSLTRYRAGKPGDYVSRLHYTTDWFVDNESKHVVKLLSHLPGAEAFTQKVGFMTTHPDKYRQLAAHPELVSALKRREETINGRSLSYIPLNKISVVESMLKTGDIVGVCTNTPGIDIAHTGLIYRDEAGVVHFMDASSKKSKMKVTIEPGPISSVLNWSKNLTGAMFARPLEP